jgi:hypothetical protein
MTQLDLTSWSQPNATPTSEPKCGTRPSIADRFASWALANRHVLDEMLRIARRQLESGAEYISTKALWEACRVSLGADREGGYRLNNDFTAPAARWLLEQEPRLVGVIELRQRRAR